MCYYLSILYRQETEQGCYNVLYLISAGPQISAAPLGIQIKIRVPI